MPSTRALFASTTVATALVALLFTAWAAAPGAGRAAEHAALSAVGHEVHLLAVDSADYADYSHVYLLDEDLLRFEADGRTIDTYRTVVQILTRDAVESWAEHTLSHHKERQRLTLNWARVVGLDGTVISDGPGHEQETEATAGEESPVYSDHIVRRITLAGVAPGTIVDLSYTLETLDPVLEGDFYGYWRFDTMWPVRRSRFVVDVPQGLEPKIEERNLDFAHQVEERDGRRVYVWEAEVPALEYEPFAPSLDEVGKIVSVSAPIGWSDVAGWYAGLARDRYEVTAGVELALAEAVLGAKTLDDSLRRVHRWVAQDIRYVSLALGAGGYQPRPADEVVATGFGDCKDKVTLFVAAARRFGVDAYPVLVNTEYPVDTLTPSAQQFDHVVVAVPGPQGYRYVDLTADLVPWGRVPEYLQGKVGVLVRPDGEGDLVRVPEEPAETSLNAMTVTGELFPDGNFRGRYVLSAKGIYEYDVRDWASEAALTREERKRMAEALAREAWEDARGDSLELFDGRDLDQEARVAVAIEVAEAAQANGSTWILTLPLETYADAGAIADLESDRARRFPIEVGDVYGPAVDRQTIEIVLPEGWRAELPPPVAVTSRFGTYRARYEQQGRRLRIERELVGRRGRESAERVGELLGWLRGVGRDGVRYVVVRGGEAMVAGRGGK